MELIDQHTKAIMEGCKERAREAGLRFDDESLEYIVSNRDLIDLSPKIMIPTLYDYWVHDVEVLKGRGRYELYPGNPYETVINTRPAISFYNDNNPDWLNVMIFYHVLGHIDFFQNNIYFRNTWDYDFAGLALSDKRMIAKLRAEKGRWLDYVIEFARGIDNLAAFHGELNRSWQRPSENSERLDYYFDIFLQEEKKLKTSKFMGELGEYNRSLAAGGEEAFFAEVHKRYPEFPSLFHKYQRAKRVVCLDLLQFIEENSPRLQKEENQWMKGVIEVVRRTSLFFQPQIRTKIMNEGWASYWHETLFMKDDRIKGHEVDFARTNAGVTAMPRVGLNPYALGMRLFYNIEEAAAKGRLSFDYMLEGNIERRRKFEKGAGGGRDYIFQVRRNYSDTSFIRRFVDQDFIDRHRLFVAGKRLNRKRNTWEYYVKSRRAEEYRAMVEDSLYHPPHIEVSVKREFGSLMLKHRFEEKPLVQEFIANTMRGIEFLWGDTVQLQTHEVVPKAKKPPQDSRTGASAEESEIKWRRVLYTMKKGELTKNILD